MRRTGDERAWWAVVAAVIVVAGCEVVPPAPVVDRVTPDWGWLGESTDIVVTGDNFFPGVRVGADAAAGRVDTDFRVYLLTEPPTLLDGVSLEDYRTLRAEVPAGLQPGSYAVRVVSPSGEEGVLTDAFDVRETRAERLAMSVDRGGYRVGEYADVSVSLLDPAGGITTDVVQVTLTAESPIGAEGVEFQADQLEGQAPLVTGVGISGNLRGSDVVRLTSRLTDDVTLTLSSPAAPDVEPARLVLSWDAGPIDHLTVTVDADVITAGDVVPVEIVAYDATGAILDDGYPIEVTLALPEGCGAPVPAAIDLETPGPYPVQFRTACEDAVIEARAAGVPSATSAPFTVVPGPVGAFAVEVSPPLVIAGNVVAVDILATDGWGNPVRDYTEHEPPRLRDDVGGIDSDAGIGGVSCSGFDVGQALCLAYPTRAARQVSVTAEGADGLSGTADPITVEPAAAAELLVELSSSRVRAGSEFEVALSLRDAYGNEHDVDPDLETVRLTDDTGSLACALASSDELLYACTVTVATGGTAVEGVVRGVTGVAPDLLQVENGALAQVDVVLAGVPAIAGDPFTVDLAGYDAYGNPYLVAVSGATVDLREPSGTLNPAVATLNAYGEAAFAATMTAAGTTSFEVYQGAVRVGASTEYEVMPAALYEVAVRVDPWVDAAAEVPVLVAGVDRYGNVVPEYVGPVSLTSVGGACEDLEAGSFIRGQAVVLATCAEPALQEALVALDDDGLGGESDPFDVLDFACATPPVAALAVEGGAEAVVCLTDPPPTLLASAAGSTGGLFHYSDSDGLAVRTIATEHSLVYDSPGTREVELVAVDPSACADRATATVYVGWPDGSPAGPVTLAVADASVATLSSTTVDISATTCTGDVAGGASLFVWADLGVPDGTASGEGLQVTLDGHGSGSFTWEFPEGYAATATVWVASADGAASGSGTTSVTGDRVHPEVSVCTPTGNVTGEVDSIVVEFTEPLLAARVSETTVTLSGPNGPLGASVTLSDDARSVTIVPDTVIDPSAGQYRPVVSRDVRDAAGNRLYGEWTGIATDWAGSFGTVLDDLPELGACSVDHATLTPDGDDGAGAEADVATFAPDASAAPDHWRLSVLDAQRTRVRSAWFDGGDSPTWDGRGDDGLVVAPAAYTLRVYAVDAQRNEARACDVEVRVAAPVAVP